MRGYTPEPLYYFLIAGIPHSAPQARGNTGRLSFRPAVGQAVPAALVSPLTPFPGISAVVLNLMLIYQPQTAQGGIFLARRSAARLKNQAAGPGHNPAPRPACKAYSVFDLPVIATTRRTAQAPARCLREKIVKGQLRFFKFLRFNKFVVVAFP